MVATQGTPTARRDRTPEAPRPSAQVEKGITPRHARQCDSRRGKACSCRPTYQAQAWSARDKKPLRRTFPTLKQARAWRRHAQVDLGRGDLSAPSETLLSDAAAEWLRLARAGVVRTRSGEPFKPSSIRGYEASVHRVILPALGHLRLSAITRNRVQDLIDGLVEDRLAASSVRNAILPLSAILRRAVEREELTANATAKLLLPKDRPGRDRVAGPREVAALLGALPERHRSLWAAAIYSGLRRGELQALRCDSVDLAAGILRVENSWDRVVGLVSPKSRSGERSVPIPGALRSEFAAQRLRSGAAEGFVFSATGERPFDPPNALRVARRAWSRASLNPIGFHECRHTYASLMIAAGVNAKALSSYMGHSSIQVTIDRYGHLLPGNEREAAGLLDRLLERDQPQGAGQLLALPAGGG